MEKSRNKLFKLIERNSLEIEESLKNGIIAHRVDVDELVNDLFALYGVIEPFVCVCPDENWVYDKSGVDMYCKNCSGEEVN